ncbi:uncharacterized protein LOC108674246 isoform X2 [Hyalella azteca]|uniref:Uncharacterized protein LOC108674246 isoform X2 n=1 Tax=Hyalella azteca TaxID=294128 RepID=A0A8B7NXR4_HYAAZ|nr:uncharacterized protein LOC108674246 isoform X2 [Hyalella azteca]
MCEVKSNLNGSCDDFTLDAALNITALAVKKGPVALCSAIYYLINENKRLKAWIQILEEQLENVTKKQVERQEEPLCCCQDLSSGTKIPHETGAIPKRFMESKQGCQSLQKNCRESDTQHKMCKLQMEKQAMLDHSFGADSGIQLSYKESQPHFISPQNASSENFCSSNLHSSKSSDSFKSSLVRRSFRRASELGSYDRDSFRTVLLKSIRRRVSSDSCNGEGFSAASSSSSSSKPDSSAVDQSSDVDDALLAFASEHGSTSRKLSVMPVEVQFHHSPSGEDELSPVEDERHELVPLEEIASMTDDDSDLMSPCPLSGCLCVSCEALQLENPDFMYFIDDQFASGTLNVGTSVVCRFGGPEPVSVVYLGHERHAQPAHPDDALPVGVVVLCPDGREQFVALNNILFVENDGTESLDVDSLVEEDFTEPNLGSMSRNNSVNYSSDVQCESANHDSIMQHQREICDENAIDSKKIEIHDYLKGEPVFVNDDSSVQSENYINDENDNFVTFQTQIFECNLEKSKQCENEESDMQAVTKIATLNNGENFCASNSYALDQNINSVQERIYLGCDKSPYSADKEESILNRATKSSELSSYTIDSTSFEYDPHQSRKSVSNSGSRASDDHRSHAEYDSNDQEEFTQRRNFEQASRSFEKTVQIKTLQDASNAKTLQSSFLKQCGCGSSRVEVCNSNYQNAASANKTEIEGFVKGRIAIPQAATDRGETAPETMHSNAFLNEIFEADVAAFQCTSSADLHDSASRKSCNLPLRSFNSLRWMPTL